MPSFSDRLRNAWNVFKTNDSQRPSFPNIGASYGRRPDRPYLTGGGDRTIISAIYNRIGIDVAAVSMQHVRLDENDRFLEEIDSGLDRCLTLSANIDQTGRQFIQDAVISMLDEGNIALAPIDTSTSIGMDGVTSHDIITMRVGRIADWYPKMVKLNLYNDQTGNREDLTFSKDQVAIIENPLYTVMNSPNSTLRRLNRKLALLDMVDEASSSNKLNLLVQLPYTIKTEMKQKQADARRSALEDQLANSKYGVAYIDSSEHVTQLNRPLENGLLDQIKYLEGQLYSQLGLTEGVINGTAGEAEMLNYYNRTIEPILGAFADSMKRAFLTQTAITQRQSIMYFRDPFRLVPVSNLAEMADKFTRNAILSSNDFRSIMSYKPSNDPEADQLRNKNLNAPESGSVPAPTESASVSNSPPE